jgi:tetratricopeptide (TPR) repeat protein
MSQRDLGDPELTHCYISLIESGKRNPSPDALEALARKLCCSPTFLEYGVSEEVLADLPRRPRRAQSALKHGRADEALSQFSSLIQDADATVLADVHREARRGRALSLEACGRIDEAIDELQIAATMAYGVAWDEWASLQACLCSCRRRGGDVNEAIELAEQAAATLKAEAARDTDAWIHVGVALLDAYGSRGDVFTARRLADRLVRAADEGGSTQQQTKAYLQAACTVDLLGDRAAAARIAEQVLVAIKEYDDNRGDGAGVLDYARLLLLRGRPTDVDQAHALLKARLRTLSRGMSSGPALAACMAELARAELAANHPHEAVDHARHATELLGDSDNDAMTEALIVLGHALIHLCRYKDSVETLQRGAICMERIGQRYQAARVWYDVAELLGITGADGQRAAYDRALRLIGLTAHTPRFSGPALTL